MDRANGTGKREGLAGDEMRGWSLSQLVGFALTNRPSMVTASLAVDDARLSLRQMAADAPIFTSNSVWTAQFVSLNGGYNASSDSAHPLNELRMDTHGNAAASLSLDLLLFDWGRYEAEVKAQAERVIAAEQGMVDTGYAIFNEVASSYFTLLEKDALLVVAFTNEYEYAEHLRQIEQKLEAGEAKQLDLLKARLDLSEAREAIVSASNDVNTAKAELVCALGMEGLGIDGGAIRHVKSMDGTGEGLRNTCRGFADSEYDSAAAFELARTNSPAMQVARARLRAASAEVDYTIANLKPEISASASLNWTDPLWLWNWGVNGVQTVFQRHNRRLAVERAVVAMREAAAEVDAAEQSLARDVDLAIAARDNSREAFATAEESVAQAKENLDLVASRYEIGDVSRVDYTDAVAAYVMALGNRVSAFYRGQRAESALFSLMGKSPIYWHEGEVLKGDEQ